MKSRGLRGWWEHRWAGRWLPRWWPTALALLLGACAADGPARAANGAVAHAVAVSEAIYANEIHGARVHEDLAYVAADQTLLEDLYRHRYRAAQARAHHDLTARPILHITRIAVVYRGRQVVNAVWNKNGSFVAAPLTKQLYLHGQPLGTLAVCEQDIVGLLKLIKVYTHFYAVAEGSSGQRRSSLPGPLPRHLPHRGTVALDGRRYAVGSFRLHAWGGEAVTVWVLEPLP